MLRRERGEGRREKGEPVADCRAAAVAFCHRGESSQAASRRCLSLSPLPSPLSRLIPIAILVAASHSPVALAKHVYKYTDPNGVVHFTDQKPGDGVEHVESTLVRTDHQPLVTMREDGTDADRTLTFVNSAGGPVTVDLSFVDQANVRAEPALPLRVVLPGLSETRATRIGPVVPNASFRYQVSYSTLPGDYRAQQSANAVYQLPFAHGLQFPIAQAFGGKATHTDKQNYYAVDIVMPEGTPILAARDGTVMTVDNDFYGAGLDMKQYGDRANNIRIAHSDGTMAVYAHLQLESAKVAVGDRVRAGQQLALSGDTGYTSGPHLHFCIQVNANMQIVSVPFNFSAGAGPFQPEPGMMLGE